MQLYLTNMSIFKCFKKKYASAKGKAIKESDFVIWDNAKGTGEHFNKSSGSLFLIDNAKKDLFFKTEASSIALVEFVYDIFFKYKSDLRERQVKGLLNSLRLKDLKDIDPNFFYIFESWDILIQDSDLSLEDKYLFLKTILPALAFEGYNLSIKKEQDLVYQIVNSPGFSSICLLIDDVLSEYGFENAYHDKVFRESFSDFVNVLSADIFLGKSSYYKQAPHYLSLKTKNFKKNYNFLSEAGVSREDGYSQWVGVSYALQSELYKFSNLVFFRVEDLEKMYVYASNYFESNSLVVTTKVDSNYSHEGKMGIIDERNSFVFDYDKIKGHMNFPDVFTSIMKNSYVAALNGVITTQVEYKMRVADSIESKQLHESNVMRVDAKTSTQEQAIRLNSFLIFLLNENGMSYEDEQKKPGFKEMENEIFQGNIPYHNQWVIDFNAIPKPNKSQSNVLRYLVFASPEAKIARACVALFFSNLKVFDSDLFVFDKVSFDVRRTRERTLKYLMEFNKSWREDPEKYLLDYLNYDFSRNKVFTEDDYICSVIMDSLFKKWSLYKDIGNEVEAYKVAIKIKDFYTLVILNSSTEYENDFWEKYSVAVDRIYQEYIYEKDKGGTQLVLVSNLDLRLFWSNRENKQISIKKMWTALERMRDSAPLFENFFVGNHIHVKYDTTLRRGPALNDNFTILMEHDILAENLFTRLMPKWFKHCINSDELTYEKMLDVIEIGKKATVS